MSDYNWCHGPDCHTYKTQSRVRGSKGNKVLRTIKIKQDSHYIRNSIYSYFCNQNCLHGFLNLHKDRIVALDPRREARETKIKDPKKETTTHRWGSYNNWTIEKRD
jgi:hypothetical protein